jgi:hypothetical protein
MYRMSLSEIMNKNLGDGLNYLAKLLSYFVNNVLGADKRLKRRSKRNHKQEKTKNKTLRFEGLILLDTSI